MPFFSMLSDLALAAASFFESRWRNLEVLGGGGSGATVMKDVMFYHWQYLGDVHHRRKHQEQGGIYGVILPQVAACEANAGEPGGVFMPEAAKVGNTVLLQVVPAKWPPVTLGWLYAQGG
jgi:hypothetical protein